MRANCTCEACSNIDALALKAFVHAGEIAVKQVRQFEELAGEPVILLHRLMKNTVPSREYVLLTSDAARVAQLDQADLREHVEDVADLGPQQVLITAAENLPAPSAEAATEPMRARPAREHVFRHLPGAHPDGLLRRLLAWFAARGSPPDPGS